MGSARAIRRGCARSWDSGESNLGCNGGTVRTQLGRPIEKADFYTVEHGVNDFGKGVPVGTFDDYLNNASNGTFYADYRQLVDRIRALNAAATIVLCTPRKSRGFGSYLPKTCDGEMGGARLADYAAAVRAIAAHEGLAVADFYATCGEESEIRSLSIDDALHPNDPGYQLMANELVRAFADAVSPWPVSLPDEDGTRAPVPPMPFPDRLSAYVWRNWGLVDVDRLAATIGARRDDLLAVAADMGLSFEPTVQPAWRRQGYITILRRNWHLLPYDQILRLIDMDRAEFAYRLKEDDFLWGKLGELKPACSRLEWTDESAAAGREARRRLRAILDEEGVDPNAPEEPRFAFVAPLARCDENVVRRPRGTVGGFDFRMIASYFADYGDPLADADIGSFPEGLLQKLAAEGVNAVWLHVVLNTLVKDSNYPEFGVGAETRVANLKRLVARARKHGIRVYLYMNEPRCVPASFFARGGRDGIRGVAEDGGGNVALCTSSPETRRWLRDSLRTLFSQVKGLGGIFTITMSENLTNCASLGYREACPRCRGRSVSDILAEVNAAMAEGVTAGDPEAETIVWNWAWPAGIEKEVFPKLPKRGCRVMHVSENGIPVTVGGVTVPEHDYSIALVGPGENAKNFWSEARKNGLGCVA